jgi:hypothetical protein
VSAEQPPFAFICYPRSVRPYVEKLGAYLRGHRVEVWYDAHNRGGDRWEKLIGDQLAAASALVVVMADDAGDHHWISKEIDQGKNLNKPILPLLLSGARYPDLAKIQEEPVTGGTMPSLPWVALLRSHLREAPPRPPDPLPQWRRPLLVGGAITMAAVVAVIVAVVMAGAAVRALSAASRTPAQQRSTAAPDGCAGWAAKIDNVSHETAGHTGRRPDLTVTVCHSAAPGHQYWIMNFVNEDGGYRSLYAKKRIDGAVANARTYPIVHSAETEVGSPRTYVVVDVAPDAPSAAQEEKTWVLEPGRATPTGMTVVSQGIPAVL